MTRSALAAGILVLGMAAGAPAEDAKTTPRPTPTTFELLKEVENRVVDEKARDTELVIGIQVTDTREGFTIEIADGQIHVRQGLPPRAAAVLSGRRSTIQKMLVGTETLSGAIRRDLVEVQGSVDKLFQLMECCIHRRPTRTPTAPSR